jgi:hypothetical protein
MDNRWHCSFLATKEPVVMILDTLNHLLGRGLSDIPIFFSALRSGQTECMVFLLRLCPL